MYHLEKLILRDIKEKLEEMYKDNEDVSQGYEIGEILTRIKRLLGEED